MLSDKFEPNDFGVLVRPQFDEKGEWTGNVSLSVMSQEAEALDNDEYNQLMYIAYKMAASVPYCMDNPAISEELDDFTESMMGEYGIDVEDVEPKEKVKSVDGNVITLDFDTPTKGNA